MSLFNINYHKIASINIFSYQEYDVFVKAISWIINGKLDLAYRLCCRFNAEVQGNPGLGCDWTTRWHNGIPSHLETICINTMNTTNSSLVTAGPPVPPVPVPVPLLPSRIFSPLTAGCIYAFSFLLLSRPS